jgi:teichuronic acid biosynthesis glycosyltransferase TuaG
MKTPISTNNQNSSVSVVIAAFNAGATIHKTLQSIEAQTRHPDEIIIVNDCSTDNTLEVISNFNQTLNLKIINNSKNFGASVSRNKGVCAASKDFIALIDADDEWHPEKLLDQVNFMIKKNLLFSHTSYQKRYASKNKTLPIRSYDVTFSDLAKTNEICCSSVIVDRRLMQKFLFPNFRMRQDWALWLNLSAKIGTLSAYPKILTTYNAEGGMSKNYFKLFFHQVKFFKTSFNVSYIIALFYTIKYIFYKFFKKWYLK